MAKADDQEAFASRVAELASDYGSAAELARTVGVATSVIRSWGTGISDPTRAKLVALCTTTKTSLTWLATGAGPKYGLGGQPVDIDILQELALREELARAAARVDEPQAQLRDCIELLLEEISSAATRRQLEAAAKAATKRLDAEADVQFAALEETVQALASRGRGEEVPLPDDPRVRTLNMRTRMQAGQLGQRYNYVATLPESERARAMDEHALGQMAALKSQREDRKARAARRRRKGDDT